MAHVLHSMLSSIAASFASFTSPSDTSMPNIDPLAVSAYSFAMISSAFSPAFSERVLGITSNAWANFSTAYWSSPGCSFANYWILEARWISVAPAPGSSLLSLTKLLIVLTPSSTARSVSSSWELVEPLRTIVASLFSSSSLLKTVTFVEEISWTETSFALPISSAVGVPSLTIA